MNTSTLTNDSLRQLIQTEEPPCVSIYVSLSENGAEREQNRIRLKNQLSRAERDLDARGISASVAETLLKPLRAMLNADPLVEAGAAGLALLRSPSAFESLTLPEPAGEVTVVSDSFFVKPLLPLTNTNQSFRVLLLSQQQVRVFEGNRYAFEPVEVPNLPADIDSALRDDDDQDQTLQFHTGATPTGADRAAIHHGHVVGDEHAKERIGRFCQLVDKAVTRHFGDQDVPLIVAANQPLPGIYNQVSAYRNLHDEAIVGDADQHGATELHARAWKLMEPYATRDRDAALQHLHEGLAKSRASTDLTDILANAYDGRVDAIFVTADTRQGGTSQEAPSAATTPGSARDNTAEQERVNSAVIETLRRGGRAFAVSADKIPEGASAAALYRY